MGEPRANMHGRNSGRLSRRRSLRGIGMTLVLVLGLLLWARLKLVTAMPRMVYADPKASAVVDPPENVITPSGSSTRAPGRGR